MSNNIYFEEVVSTMLYAINTICPIDDTNVSFFSAVILAGYLNDRGYKATVHDGYLHIKDSTYIVHVWCKVEDFSFDPIKVDHDVRHSMNSSRHHTLPKGEKYTSNERVEVMSAKCKTKIPYGSYLTEGEYYNMALLDKAFRKHMRE